MFELKNKVVLITGAANGIGAGVVKMLLEEGVKYVAMLDTDEKSGLELQAQLSLRYGNNKVGFFKSDVTNEAELFGTYRTVMDINGYIDVVINNAGILNDSLESYKKEIEINLTALVTSTLKAFELMRKDEGGRGGTVINISSVTGITQLPFTPIYNATKSAVVQFSNCIGMDEYYSKTGVRVVVICFGVTETTLLTNVNTLDKLLKDKLNEFQQNTHNQRIESAAQGVIQVYKNGDSGSTWLVHKDQPAKDITDTLKKAVAMLSEGIFD